MSKSNKSRGKQTTINEATTSNNNTPVANGVASESKRNVKRARTETATAKKTHNKETQTDCSTPRGLTNIPIEIFMEITSYTNPLDLLSLARSCKALREILMKQSSAQIWRAAENNVPGLPHCPDNMDAPFYTALVFTKNCTTCDKVSSAPVDPFLCLRLCTDCREEYLTEALSEWKQPYPNLELVSSTTLIKIKAKDAARRPNGSGIIAYCLSEEADEILAKQRELVAAGDTKALQRWRIGQHNAIKACRRFERQLGEFLTRVDHARSDELGELKMQRRKDIEDRLRELGWSDRDFDFYYWTTQKRWIALVEQPRPLTDRIWTNLLPKLVPILEQNHAHRLEGEKTARNEARLSRLDELLQDLKPQINPFHGFLLELGLDPAQLPDPPTDISKHLHSLVDYPFPNSATAAKWPCLEDIQTLDISLEKLQNIFNERQEDVRDAIDEWINQGEQELLEWWKLVEPDVSSDENTDDSDAELDEDLSSTTELLLRADTVFSSVSPGTLGGQGQPHHYPDFISKVPYRFYYYQSPNQMIEGRYYRHQDAESITKEILGDIGMPDTTYHSLKILGAKFVCERCDDKEPKTWDDMLQHFLEAKVVQVQQLQRGQIIKTKTPIRLWNTHCLASSPTPLVRLLTGEEPQDPTILPIVNPRSMLDCLLCKNYHHRLSVRNLDEMSVHLRNAHSVQHAREGLMYESSANGDCFHDRERAWKQVWKSNWDRVIIEDNYDLKTSAHS